MVFLYSCRVPVIGRSPALHAARAALFAAMTRERSPSQTCRRVRGIGRGMDLAAAYFSVEYRLTVGFGALSVNVIHTGDKFANNLTMDA